MIDDIDLDSERNNRIFAITRAFCKMHNYDFSIKKDTNTVNKVMINYDKDLMPLKVEVSLHHGFHEEDTTKINGIKTYKIDKLLSLKLEAFIEREKIRDAFDLAFIYLNYKDEISLNNKKFLAESVLEKGVKNLDYLLENRGNELMNLLIII